MKGIDCSARLNAASAKKIKSLGYDFVGRYCVPISRAKAVTPAEARAILDAGLGLLLCWELTADRVKGGAAKGSADGVSAANCAKALGAPAGTTLYFAVDYEASDGEMDAIAAYLKAAQQAAPDYRCGVYGSYAVVQEMAKRGVCACYWQCVAWSYGKLSPHRNVYQREWQNGPEAADVGKALGFAVDINECADLTRAGIWIRQEAEDMAAKRYDRISQIPEWGQLVIKKLCRLGVLEGKTAEVDAQGYPAALDLSEDMIRMLVINDRAGVYDGVVRG